AVKQRGGQRCGYPGENAEFPCGCPRERLVNSGDWSPERDSRTGVLPSTGCGKRFVRPKRPRTQDGSVRSPGIPAPGGHVTDMLGYLRWFAGGVRLAGGAAGGLVFRRRATGPRAIRRLLAGGSIALRGAGRLVERGHIQFRPAADETIRVVEVLVGGQQVWVRPHGVPPGGAPDVG